MKKESQSLAYRDLSKHCQLNSNNKKWYQWAQNNLNRMIKTKQLRTHSSDLCLTTTFIWSYAISLIKHLLFSCLCRTSITGSGQSPFYPVKTSSNNTCILIQVIWQSTCRSFICRGVSSYFMDLCQIIYLLWAQKESPTSLLWVSCNSWHWSWPIGCMPIQL